MRRRIWQKGLVKASQWAVQAAREGFQIPIPQGLLNKLVERVDDPSVRGLALAIRDGDRLELSGLKKKGVWVQFSAAFLLEAPGDGDPPQSLVLILEEAEPFFAKGALLTALGDLDGVSAAGDRVLVDVNDLIDRNEWGRKVPQALRSRLRITDIGTQEGRINLRVGLT